MTNRAMLERCYLLHARPYRDTSVLATLFSEQHGIVNAIARGVRTMRSPWKGLLQSFTPLLVSWSGKSDLMTLKDVEFDARYATNAGSLKGTKLWSAMYINELLTKLLHAYDPHVTLYHHYQSLMQTFDSCDDTECALRYFERALLDEIGFGIQFDTDAHSGQTIEADQAYLFSPERGFMCAPAHSQATRYLFTGAFIQAFANETLELTEHRTSAKRLMRIALDHVLANKTIQCRAIFARTRSLEICD